MLATTACQGTPTRDQLHACSEQVPSFNEVDSSGITLALNGAAPHQLSLLERTPTVVLGAELGLNIATNSTDPNVAEPMLFGSITHARALPDGRIVVLDGKAVAARLFSSDGEHLRDIGRSGRGPGEFQRVSDVFVGAADTLWLFDGYGGRLLGFDVNFQSVATIALPRYEVVNASKVPGGDPLRIRIRLVPRAQLDDGRWLLSGLASNMDHEEVSSVSRDSTRLYVWNPLTDEREPRELLLGTQRYELFTSDGSITFGDVALGFTESFAAATNRYFVGNANTFAIEERLSDGSLARVIRVCSSPIVLSAKLADSLDAASDEADVSSALPHEADARRFVPRPRPAPAYYELLHDQSDRLWAREFTAPSAPHAWSVFDASGKRVLRVTLPSHQMVLDAGRDWVLVRNESEYGEATLHRYTLP